MGEIKGEKGIREATLDRINWNCGMRGKMEKKGAIDGARRLFVDKIAKK
jgi:hypothetical protein